MCLSLNLWYKDHSQFQAQVRNVKGFPYPPSYNYINSHSIRLGYVGLVYAHSFKRGGGLLAFNSDIFECLGTFLSAVKSSFSDATWNHKWCTCQVRLSCLFTWNPDGGSLSLKRITWYFHHCLPTIRFPQAFKYPYLDCSVELFYFFVQRFCALYCWTPLVFFS